MNKPVTSILTVQRGDRVLKLSFEAPEPLASALERAGVPVIRPCGGRGICGKCAVGLTGCVSEPNDPEVKAGRRLVCQAVLLGDAQVRVTDDGPMEQIELSESGSLKAADPMPGRLGAAVDIGTTTLAVSLFDLTTGRVINKLGAENPQRSVAGDVMGRISAALNGKADVLREQITDAVTSLLDNLLTSAGRGGERVDSLVITGNTTMLYLLTGQDTACLSRAPFAADRLFDEETELLGGRAWLPPCVSAFVGADITCAVLASGMCRSEDTAMLCDIGTNGEIALWKNGVLYVTSTAAGPAFEGAGISCGCGSVRGAVDRVWAEDGRLRIHTIGDAAPVGLCGSGLLDALAALLELGLMDETGAIHGEAVSITPQVSLTRADIRAAQLAKAAVAAGMETLLKVSGTDPEEIAALYIAGGFGGHINISGAVRIGLIPREFGEKVRILGNAALAGAERLLLDRGAVKEIRRVAGLARPVNLGGDPAFNECFVDHLYFEEGE